METETWHLPDIHVKNKKESTSEPPKGSEKLFDNLPDLIRLERVSELLGVSKKTLYDWKYRSRIKGIPEGLFYKLRGSLFVRTKVLRQWMASQDLR